MRMLNPKVSNISNCRWDLLSPESSGSGGWEMAVTATRPIAPDEQVLLSYGERGSDEFFLYYGNHRCRQRLC